MLSVRAAAVFNPLRCITRIVSNIQLCKRKTFASACRDRDFSKLSYFHKPGKEPLLTWTAGDVIDRATDLFGDTTAMIYTHQNIRKTYTDYGKDVGINLTCSATELEVCLNTAECPALIIGDKFTTKDYYQMLLQIAPELENSAPGELNSKRLPFLKHVITIGDTRKPGSMTFDDLMDSVTAEDYATMNSASARVQFGQDAFIQFSSPESICINSELIHGSGRTMGVLAATLFGSTIVMAGPTFLPKLALEVITKHRCTMIFGSTTLFFAMMQELEEGVHDVSSVRKAIMGGSICNPATIEKAITRLNAQRVYIVYGSSETSPVITCTNPDEPTDRWIRTLGTPLDHVEVKVVDAEGRIVPWNTRGELCTRSPYVFNGYLNNEAMTKDAVRDNWYHTGDEVTMNEDGRVTFVGRIKEMINFKGFKVAPLEIENILNTHPDVEEAQVIGVPDERTLEKVCAWIKLKSDKSLTQEDITDFCKEKELHEIKLPEFVLFVDSFPRTHTGKVQKNKMRDESVRIFNL